MRQHGAKVVFFGRFVPVLRDTAAWMAGIAGCRGGSSCSGTPPAAVGWATLVGLVSYYLGAAGVKAMQRDGIGIAVIAGIVVCCSDSPISAAWMEER